MVLSKFQFNPCPPRCLVRHVNTERARQPPCRTPSRSSLSITRKPTNSPCKCGSKETQRLCYSSPVVGVAAALTFDIQETQPFLIDVIAKFAGITDQARLNELRKSFPYNLIQTILMMIILYLMVILYHRTSFIRRCYAYLDAIEPELKSGLGLDPVAVAFTREGSFYHRYKSTYAGFVAAT
jgi:hypothetical protein